MATAVKLSDEAPFPAPRRLAGALAAGVVIGSAANAFERIRVVGLGTLRVRAKPTSITGTLTLQIYPVLSDALDTSSTGTRAATSLPVAATASSALEVYQDYVLAGEQYVDVKLSMSGGGADTTTLAYVDVFTFPDATVRPLLDAAGAAVISGAVELAAPVEVSDLTATNPLRVMGTVADGAAVSGNPLRIGGKDGSGNTQDILTTTAGVLQAEMQGTGINVAASTYYNAAVSADVDAAVAAVTGLRLVGLAVRETAGATAVFAIVNGATGAAAGKVFPVNLAANESTSEWLHPGIACASGISIDWVSGAFAIALHYAVAV